MPSRSQCLCSFFFLMIRRPPRSTLFPTRRSSDLPLQGGVRITATQMAQAIAFVLRERGDRKSTRLNSSHSQISYAVFCLKKKKQLPFSFDDETQTTTMGNTSAATATPYSPVCLPH